MGPHAARAARAFLSLVGGLGGYASVVLIAPPMVDAWDVVAVSMVAVFVSFAGVVAGAVVAETVGVPRVPPSRRTGP